MASAYGYITVANLESYHVLDYETLDARYTDAVVEAQISQAERIVRTLTNTTSTTDDGAIAMVTELSKWLMYNLIISDHPESQIPEPNEKLLAMMFGDKKLVDLVSYSPTGTIPMQGIDR